MLDDILNRVPMKQAPYVGASAFAHKAGLHASAIVKDPTTYEHIDPALVGNCRIMPMSNQAGQSNLRERLAEAGLTVERRSGAGAHSGRIKEREVAGYAYDTAQASFELLARDELGLLPTSLRSNATASRWSGARTSTTDGQPVRGGCRGQSRWRKDAVGQ